MIKKNWYFILPLALICLPLLLVGWNMSVHGYDFADALKATRYVGASGTRYPVKYSAAAFNAIKPGMDGRQVFEKIGVPFEGQGGLEWKYSLPTGMTQYYHERTVVFERDKNNVPRVKALISRFHTPE